MCLKINQPIPQYFAELTLISKKKSRRPVIFKKLMIDPSLRAPKIKTEIENENGIAASTTTVARVLKKYDLKSF